MASASVFVPRMSHSPASPTSPRDSLRPAGRCGPRSCQMTAFALSSGEHETLCSPSWQLLHLLLPIQLTVILYLPKLFFFF